MLPTKLLTETAQLPTRGHPTDAGLDLYLDMTSEFSKVVAENPDMTWDAETSILLDVGKRTVLKTGIAIAIPEGFYGQISPRSGLSVKNGLEILAGVIDSDYRGELMIAVLNSGYETIKFKHGDRVAQLILIPCSNILPNTVDELPETTRGAGKFGSTGK